MRNNSKTKGDIAELQVAVEFAKRGHIVSRPLSDNAPYDLIVDFNGALKKVQVKARKPYRGKIQVEMGNRMINYRGHYKDGDFDLMVIINTDNDKIAILSWNEIREYKTAFILRVDASDSSQKVRLFNDHLLENYK